MHGAGGIVSDVHAHGLPTAFAYGVYLGEFLAPILVIVGFATRIGAALIALDMLVAVWLVHTAQIFALGKTGGYALELQAFYFLGAVTIIVLGPGRLSLSRAKGWWA
jgi:putative oxidoreductase